MGLLSLIVALVALLLALLALRRADVVEKRAKSVARAARNTQTGDQSDGGRSGGGGDSAGLEAAVHSGLNRIAVVRYNAFDDVGGQLSYSAALLDDAGNGIVLTSIHNRAETRSYIKQVGGKDTHVDDALSAEEQEALRKAMAQP